MLSDRNISLYITLLKKYQQYLRIIYTLIHLYKISSQSLVYLFSATRVNLTGKASSVIGPFVNVTRISGREDVWQQQTWKPLFSREQLNWSESFSGMFFLPFIVSGINEDSYFLHLRFVGEAKAIHRKSVLVYEIGKHKKRNTYIYGLWNKEKWDKGFFFYLYVLAKMGYLYKSNIGEWKFTILIEFPFSISSL